MCPYGWKNIVKNNPVWFKSTLSDILKHRERLFRNYRRGGRCNKEILQRAITKRREFDKACKLAKINFYREQLSLYQKDHRKFWSVIHDLLGGKQNTTIDLVFKF